MVKAQQQMKQMKASTKSYIRIYGTFVYDQPFSYDVLCVDGKAYLLSIWDDNEIDVMLAR